MQNGSIQVFKMSYLARGIVGQPALQVSGIPAREQASALQVAQLLRGLRLRRDHLVEGVIEGHRVIVSTLVLKSTSWIQEQEHDSILHFSVQTPMTQHSPHQWLYTWICPHPAGNLSALGKHIHGFLPPPTEISLWPLSPAQCREVTWYHE